MKDKLRKLAEYYTVSTEAGQALYDELCVLFSVSGSYSIDFGKHCKAKIQIENGEPKVEAAMNGWGEGISLSDITIEKL